jgi:hypothetical protein
MSFGITVEVDDAGEAKIVGITRGDYAKPPAGRYSINGHKHREGDATSSVSLQTPIGGCAGFLQP